MKIRADLHIHSKYSRATSKEMVPETIAQWAEWKGIDLIATGDFTHPAWLDILKQELKEKESGIYQLKTGQHPQTSFIVTGEISLIFSRVTNNVKKVYRHHFVIILPSIESAEKVNVMLAQKGNIASDGRPILGLDCKELMKVILDVEPEAIFIPAHIWTPWFSLFGAKSGFNSMKEAYGDLTKYIAGLETGLSSDPEMNWLISELDDYSLISNSDAHSPANLAREATVFDLKKLTFASLSKAIKDKERGELKYTIEFFPQEGKYHYDGHRKCKVCWSPQETRKHKNICSACGRPVTVGVSNRVMELADRDKPKIQKPGFKSIIPLAEIISTLEGVGVKTKTVSTKYHEVIDQVGSELDVLEGEFDQQLKSKFPDVALGVKAMQAGQVDIKPGFDGEYGKISVKIKKAEQQKQLFKK